MDCFDHFVRELTTPEIFFQFKFKFADFIGLISFARLFFGNTTDQKTEASSALDYSDSPIIEDHNVLKDGYESAKDEKHLLILIKKIISAFENFFKRPINYGRKDDSKEVSLRYDKLLNSTNKEEIIPIPSTHKGENALKAHRNVEGHVNYYCAKYLHTKHKVAYQTVLEKLAFDKNKQERVENLRKNEWLIWNWYKRNNTDELIFCYIIKDKDYQALFDKFKNECKKIIEKSVEYPYIKKRLYAKYQKEAICKESIKYIYMNINF